ncbi:hypothetical protein ABZ512_20585 [Nocardiopsis dassonvillei]|uniref:hypothetical protein n=1 Tax=Nocardiopsis dassonvillei TaxID=2014 RepID=UPI00340FEBC6
MSQARCADCGRLRQVGGYRPGGDAVCGSCYRTYKPKVRCEGCGQMEPPAVKAGGRSGSPQTLCRRCYRSNRPKRRCDCCGRIRVINSGRSGSGEPALCVTCYTKARPETVCPQCGQRFHGSGNKLCPACYEHPRRVCGICGRKRRVAVKASDSGPDICPTCHQAPKVDCSVCSQRLHGRLNGHNSRPACFGCMLATRVEDLLTGADGTIAPELLGVRDVLVDTSNPQAALSNFGRSKGHKLLRDIAAGRLPLTHATLDDQEQGYSVRYLRDLLVATGALQARDEPMARLEAFAQVTAEGAHPSDRGPLSLFARTHRLRRIRTRYDSGEIPPSVSYNARCELTTAARFLAWLRSRGRDRSTCNQADIDAWISISSTNAQHTTGFLNWAIRHRHMPDLVVPLPLRSFPSQFAPEDQRWTLAKRLLTDTSIDLVDRIAGSLVLLYAQPVSRIAPLTRSQVVLSDAKVSLRLGHTDLDVIAPLAELVTHLLAVDDDRPTSDGEQDPYLFPGRLPGRPLHPATLARRLHALGVDPRVNRNGALMSYARQLPPPIFGRLLGLALGTAEQWAQIAGGKWARYRLPSR